MKKMTAMMAAAVLCLSLAACGSTDSGTKTVSQASSKTDSVSSGISGADSSKEDVSGAESKEDTSSAASAESTAEPEESGDTSAAGSGESPEESSGSEAGEEDSSLSEDPDREDPGTWFIQGAETGKKYATLTLFSDPEDPDSVIRVKVEDQELAEAIGACSSCAYLQTFTKDGEVLEDYNLVDLQTGESFGAISAKDIILKYAPEGLCDTVEWIYDSEYSTFLSYMELGTIYEAPTAGDMTFINDTNQDLLVYYESDKGSSGVLPHAALMLDGLAEADPVGYFMEDDVVRVRVEAVDPKTLDRATPGVAFVDDKEPGEKIKYQGVYMLVNGGDKDVTISFNDFTGQRTTEVIPAGGVRGFEWLSVEGKMLVE